jgi:hypothetical protein
LQHRSAAAALVALTVAAAGCTPLATTEGRASKSTVGCIRAAIAGRDLGRLPDSEAHCVAAGLIARRCSVTESTLASVGKEIQDAIGSGDAEWRDLSADRRGVQCARTARGDEELAACCAGTEF